MSKSSRKMGIVLIVIGIFMLGAVGVKWVFTGNFVDVVSGVDGEVAEEGSKTFDPSAIKKVVVRNSVGEINVQGDGNAKEATVHYTKYVASKWGMGSRQVAVERADVDVQVKGDRAVIEVTLPDGSFLAPSVYLSLDITLPPNVEVETENKVGGINIAGMNTPVRATNDVGNITIDGFRESVDATASAGAISIRGGQAIKDVMAESAVGRIDIELPRDARLNVRAKTDTGSISSSFNELDSHVEKLTTGARLNAQIGDGSQGTIDLTSDTGSIKIFRQ
ncbi:MAG: DUF4097 family beta strand repeat-containing protein [Tumebacillaceae bacterium]